MKNVYEGIPANGTVMGKLTEQELKDLKQLCIDYEIRMTGTPHFQQYEDFEKYADLVREVESRRQEIWLPIYKRLNISWAWELKADLVNGVAYLINYEHPSI